MVSSYEHRCPNCDLLMQVIERLHSRMDAIATIVHFADVRYPAEQQERIEQQIEQWKEHYASPAS